MKNLRAFKVVTIPPTDTSPVKVKVTDIRFNQSIVLSYRANTPSTENELVIDYLNKLGIEVIAQAWEEKHGQQQYTLLLTPNFDKRLKTV